MVFIEQRLDFSRWVENGFGTGDCVIIADEVLHIIDYKHGLGVLVESEGNSQMMCYALGALEAFDDLYDISTIELTIFQPRRENVSTSSISKEDLLKWAEDVLKPTAALAYEGKGEFKAGDHCQLPPTVKSMAALKGGLSKTLMERIVERKPAVVTLLKVQYRMNEEIMRFSSDWFYHGEVVSAPQVSHRGILDYDIPMDWIAVEGEAGEAGEEFVGNSFGRVNKREAELTLDVLRRYFVKIGKRRVLDEQIDVGVISPYRAQVQYLRALIKKDAFFKPFRHLLSVNTVDGFQGQERDVILISLVRSNAEGQIGFLRDLRRMNVAITRARMKLMILGDPATLCRHPFYKRLYDYVRSLGGTEAADPETTP